MACVWLYALSQNNYGRKNYENLELYVTSKQGHHSYTLTHKLVDKFPLPLKKIQRSTYAVKLDVLIEL